MSVGPHYQLLAVDDDRGDLELLRMHLNAFMKPSLHRIEEAVTVLSREGGGPGARAWDKPWRDARFSVERLERFVSNLELMNGLDRGTVDVQSGVFDFQRTAQESGRRVCGRGRVERCSLIRNTRYRGIWGRFARPGVFRSESGIRTRGHYGQGTLRTRGHYGQGDMVNDGAKESMPLADYGYPATNVSTLVAPAKETSQRRSSVLVIEDRFDLATLLEAA